MGARKKPVKKNLMKALAHPLRVEILKEFAGKNELSPKECAKGMGLPLANLSYHFRVLAEYKAIVLVRTQQVRGAQQHFYRFDISEEWALAALDLGPPTSSA